MSIKFSCLRGDALGKGRDFNVWLDRQLDSLRADIYEMEGPRTTAFDVFEQDDSDPRYKSTYTHRMWEPIGVAEAINDHGSDYPRASASVTKNTFNYQWFGSSYELTMDDIEKAEAENTDLPDMMARASRRANDLKLNQIQWFGDPTYELYGALTNKDVPRIALNDPWVNATPAQTILDQFNAGINIPFNVTDTHAQVNRVAMAGKLFSHVNNRYRSDSVKEKLIDEMLDNHWSIDEIIPAPELNDAGPNGEHLIHAQDTREEPARHKVPEDYDQMDPEQRNQAIITNARSKSGGIVYDYPFHSVIMEVPTG